MVAFGASAGRIYSKSTSGADDWQRLMGFIRIVPSDTDSFAAIDRDAPRSHVDRNCVSIPNVRL